MIRSYDYISCLQCGATHTEEGRLMTYSAQEEVNHMTRNNGVRVARCPTGERYCFPSCYFHKDSRCCFRSRGGKQIRELKEASR